MKQKIILFGASKLGKITFGYIKDQYDVLFFCDNDREKWDTTFCSLKIKNPEILKMDEYKKNKIIITSMYNGEIYKQLIELGIEKNNIQISDLVIKDYLQKEYESKEYTSIKNLIDNFDKNNKINLHIMEDNFFCKKFIQIVNRYFEAGKHKFVIISNTAMRIKYVDDYYKYTNVEVLYLNEYAELKLYLYVKSAEKLFIHYLTDFMSKFICEYEIWNKTELNWCVWGGDFYTYINYKLYDNDTKEFLGNSMITNYNQENFKYKCKVINKITNILTPIQNDYKLIIENFDTNAKYVRFLYPNPVEYKNIDENSNEKFKFKYDFVIQVGNSGTATNNHIDLFNKLSKINLKNSCIICPLSYGDTEYINRVISYGNKMFGSRFVPIKSFIRQDKYFKLLNSVDIAIMPHNRQQGFSNILTLLYLGKKVFLKEHTSSYKELLSIGARVSTINDLDRIASINEITKLNYDDKNNNKEVISKWFSDEKALEHLVEIFG